MPSELFNLVEGLWWIGLGIWIVWHNHTTYSQNQSPACPEPSGPRIKSGVTIRRLTLLAIILTLFGISDFVEIVTGAWWQPWWLLAWKGLCLGVGLILIILICTTERRRQ